MRQILVLGAGQSATFLVARLLEEAENENWFVTVEGVGFSYSPYEISSFSQGFIVFTIPFAELKPWLMEDSFVMRMIPAGG